MSLHFCLVGKQSFLAHRCELSWCVVRDSTQLVWSSPVREVLERSPLWYLKDSDGKDVVWDGLCFLLFWRPLLCPMQEVPN